MKNIIWIITALLLLTGCATVVSKYESADKSLIYSLKAESEFSIMTDKTGKKWGELTSPFLFKTTLTGSVETDNTGDMVFTIENAKFFANWPNGWTEGKSQAIGKLLFKKNGDGFKCQVTDKVEIWDVVEGRIRYMEDYYLGDEGLALVKHRMDRLTVVSQFLKKQQLPEFFGHTFLNTKYGESMKSYVMPILFPEKAGDKPVIYEEIINSKDQSDDKNKISDNWSLGSDLLWNKKYTAKIFINEFKNLQEVRNTGSMWRDYEEAPGILMMLYNLDYYVNKKLASETFILKKK